MIGSALGDAIGELAFRHPNKENLCAQLDKREEYRYTDDTAMALGIAESLTKQQDLDQQALGAQFHENYLKEPWRGYGPGPPTIFRMVESEDIGYERAAASLFGGTGSFGNGAAMRIAPIGLFFHKSPQLYEKACLSAAVTHAHPVGQDGAALQATAVALAVNLSPSDPFDGKSFIDKLISSARTREMKDKMLSVRQLLDQNTPPAKAADRLGRSVAVHESQPFALYSFLRCPKSFTGCLFCAVLNGGDRDTLGAMACAISGAYLGTTSIPASWAAKLENLSHIKDLASGLADMKV